MKLKVYFLITFVIVVTFYILYVALRLCEPFATEADNAYYQQTINTLYTSLSSEPKADDIISDANLPYAFNVYNKEISNFEIKNTEYIIISSYKKILNRNPTSEELNKDIQQFNDGELDENLLRVFLYNSTEYMMNSKVQTNEVEADIEYAYAKHDLITIISRIYFEELNAEVPKAMLLPLRDIFMFLENDMDLFTALLINENYKKFEDEVLASKGVKKENILEIFNKHFVYDSLKLRANDIKRYNALNRLTSPGTPPPSALPVSTSFVGTDLQVANQNLGAGSGAQQTQQTQQEQQAQQTKQDESSALRAYQKSLI
jgi:hypothetical protein